MTTPTAESDLLLDPWEAGIDEDEAQRRRIAARQSLIALLDEWIAEGENATEEERRIAEQEWEELKRALDEDRLPGNKLFP